MRESHKSIHNLEYLHNMQCLNVHGDTAPVSDVQSSQQERGLNWPVHINFRHVEVSDDEGRSKWGLSRGLSNSKYRRRQDREGFFGPPHHHLKVFFYGLLIMGIIVRKNHCNGNFNDFCSSQPSMVQWLSSSIFPFCRRRPSRYGNIRPNLHFYFP